MGSFFVKLTLSAKDFENKVFKLIAYWVKYPCPLWDFREVSAMTLGKLGKTNNTDG